MTAITRLPSSYLNSTTSRWYYLASAFFIMQGTGFFSILDRITYGDTGGKSTFAQALSVLQIFVSVLIFWIGYNKSRRLDLGVKLLLVVVAYLFISVIWSVDPSTSLRRSFIYLFFVLGVVGIANSLNSDEYMRLMRRIVFLSATASLLLLILTPPTVLMPDGALRGIFSHKSVLGQVMVAGVLASLHGIRVGAWRSSVIMIILFLFITLAARSSTSIMIIIAVCTTELLMIMSGIYFSIIMAIVFVPTFILLVLSPDLILEFLGKDSTLTGRTDLWHFVDICISQRPLLGWGFSAFWESTNPAASEISMNLGWSVPQAHHGLRELLLETGAVGTFLFMLVFAGSIWIGVRSLRTPSHQLGKTLLLCCAGIFMLGVSEEVLVDPSQISVGLLFVLALTGERMLRAVPQQQHFRPIAPTLQSVSARTGSVKMDAPEVRAISRRAIPW